MAVSDVNHLKKGRYSSRAGLQRNIPVGNWLHDIPCDKYLYVFCTRRAKHGNMHEGVYLEFVANVALSWWGGSGSNRRPTDYESAALLRARLCWGEFTR